MKTLTYIKHCLFLLFFNSSIFSQSSVITPYSNTDPVFQKVNIEIDNEEVLSFDEITQDHQGYMWMSTNVGLIRYDGIEAKKYKLPTDSLYNIRDPVYTLFVDSHGDLWVGSKFGLSKYNPDCDCLYRHPLTNEDSSLVSVFSITEDKNKNIWIGTKLGGLYKYEREHDRFTRFLSSSSDPINIVNSSVDHLLVDQNNNIWIGTNYSKNQLGLMRYNLASGSVDQFLNDPLDPNSLVDNRISALYEDQQGQILIGTYKSGFHIYNSKNESLKRISFDANNPGQIHAPYMEDKVFGHAPYVSIIHQDQNGGYWIGTKGKGINFFNSRTKTFKYYDFNLVYPQTLSSFYEDRQGNIWIGAFMGGGLFRTDLFARKHTLNTNFINVQGAYESPLSPGILWITSLQQGLSKMNLKTKEITRYVHKKSDPKSIGHNWVRSAYQENNKILWVGLGTGNAYGGQNGNGGVDRMDIETGEFTHFKLTRDNDGMDDFSYTVFNICEDNEGYLWLGTGPGGIFRSDKKKKDFKHFNLSKNDSLSRDVRFNTVKIDSNGDQGASGFEDEGILYLYDSNGGLWVSDFEDEGALYLFNSKEENFQLYLKGFKATNVLVDKKGWLLISTWEKGLLHFNSADSNYIQYTKKDGLPSNDALGIVEGNEGNFWISTRMGPAKFNSETGKIYSLGLPKVRYNYGIFKASDGQIFLGVNNGLVSFYPNQVMGNPYPPDVILENIQVTGKSFNLLNANSKKPKQVLLNHEKNDLTFKYAGLHYSDPAQNQHQYMLEPYDTNWIDAGTQRSARYTNLNPGEYTFQVIASNSDGVWNEKGASINITIKKAWWQTWWAYTISLFVTIIAIYGIRKYELNRIRLKNQLKLESVASKKLRELDQVKSRFFANISHEFRTPLTLILGQISNTLSNKLDSKIKSNLEVANKNAQRLLHLINQLLDLSKIESGSMSTKNKRADIVLFIKNIFYSFESLAKQREISYNCICNYTLFEFNFDPRKLEKVFFNLLSNAFKFTPVNGKIDVTIKHIFSSTTLNIADIDNKSGIIEILVADTGSGVSAENIPHIFNRFYQVDNSTTWEHQGTGIGLALSKELVELHGGTISVASEIGVGSTFIVQLPFEDCKLVYDNQKKTEPELTEQTIDYKEIKEVSLTLDDKGLSYAKTSYINNNGREIILVVEDNVDVRNYIVEQLTNDFQIFEAEDGEEGISLAKIHTPDLIITDVMMPIIDGCQLTTELKQDEKTSHIPIIMLTAKAAIDNKIEGFEIGADDYILKPFNSEELLVRVKNLIATRQRLRKKFSKATIIKPSDVTAVSLDQQFLQKALNIIDKYFEDEQFGVNKLAEKANMSVSQLNRKLRALIDQPAGQLIRSMRLQRAADLLKKESGTIAEICYQVGFNDQTSFTRAFKKQFGDPPSKYIIKLKNNNDKPLLS